MSTSCDFCGVVVNQNVPSVQSESGVHICFNCLLKGVDGLIANNIFNIDDVNEYLTKASQARAEKAEAEEIEKEKVEE